MKSLSNLFKRSTHLFLSEFEVRTVRYGPISFSGRIYEQNKRGLHARLTREAYTRGLQYKRKNEVSKIFIISRVQQRGKGPIQTNF